MWQLADQVRCCGRGTSVSDIANRFLRTASQCATTAKMPGVEHEVLTVVDTLCERGLVLERDEWEILSS